MPSIRLQAIIRNKQRDFVHNDALDADHFIAVFEVEIEGVRSELKVPVPACSGDESNSWFKARELCQKALYQLARI